MIVNSYEYGRFSKVHVLYVLPDLEIWTFKGHVEVRISKGSGIWDPQFEIMRIEIMKTDRIDNSYNNS